MLTRYNLANLYWLSQSYFALNLANALKHSDNFHRTYTGRAPGTPPELLNPQKYV